MGAGRGGGSGGWRAAGLLAVAVLVSAVHPAILIAVPFAFLAFFVRPRRAPVVAAGVVALVLALTGEARGGLWYVDRGWALLLAGSFVAATLARPRSRFFPRAMSAVGGAAAGAALVLAVVPDGWGVVDWMIMTRMRSGTAAALEALRLLQGDGGISTAVEVAAHHATDLQHAAFPAMLALSSVASLGVAWWGYVRLAGVRERALGPLRDFRFNDQLIWILVAGVLLLVVPLSGLWERAATNAVLFMGVLYAARGAAVVLFASGGLSFLGAILLGVAFLFLAPFILAGALLIGLGDTWLDIRGRIRRLPGGA